MTPFEAIFNRKSIRHYRKEAVPDNILEKIQDFDGELLPMFPYVKTVTKVFREEEFSHKELMFQVRAPYYLAIYAQELEGCQENAGNMMQQIALYLHGRGVGSCFLGLLKPPKGAECPEGMKFIIMLAFGYPKEELNRDCSRADRLPLEKLCVFKQEPLKATSQLLEAARLAPSSMNSQPWKFVVYRNRIHIFVSEKRALKPVGKWSSINMGIMMANILLTAEEYWIDVVMTRSENLAEKTIPHYSYTGSVLVKP